MDEKLQTKSCDNDGRTIHQKRNVGQMPTQRPELRKSHNGIKRQLRVTICICLYDCVFAHGPCLDMTWMNE